MINHILDLHFDPVNGSGYWLDVLEKKGIHRQEFKTAADLHLLGPMNVEALRTRPITDFIPKLLHNRLAEMLLSETGGSTGDPCRRVYLPAEFDKAFVAPWRDAVQNFEFPQQGRWLFVGPSGPHIIAQAARAFARATGCLEPFSIDCDVRWIRQQKAGSMGYLIYMEHLYNQALNIISHQKITVLFTTPPLLLGLASRMTPQQRHQIEGIHTGGMSQDTATSRELARLFPQAIILPGYGNSLFGVTFEKKQDIGKASTFYVHDPSLHLKLIPLPESVDEPPRLTEAVALNHRGRVVFHRFDESFLIINMLERDTAIRIFDGENEGFYDVNGLDQKFQSDGEVY